MRYAASAAHAAARERFPGRRITAEDEVLVLVKLHLRSAAIDLTDLATLDALGLDDRISTGRLDDPSTGDPLLETAQSLSDAVWDWWSSSPPPVVYRTRSTPDERNIAFTEHARLVSVDARPLREAVNLLARLVVEHGFSIPEPWLG